MSTYQGRRPLDNCSCSRGGSAMLCECREGVEPEVFPYELCLGARIVCARKTFAEACVEYRKFALLNGARIVNSERSDADDDGLTEDERLTLVEIHNEVLAAHRARKAS